MEKALLAALERANDLIQRQGKALEEQRVINDKIEAEYASLVARLTAANLVIHTLIDTHPDREALLLAWENWASFETERLSAVPYEDGEVVYEESAFLKKRNAEMKRQLEGWEYCLNLRRNQS